MQTLELILCSQCVIYTLRGIWGFMSGHVCETGGTREVLPPRHLKHISFKNLLENQDRLREPFVGLTLTMSDDGCDKGCNKTRSKRATRRKIVLLAGSTILGRLATYIMDSSKG